MELQRTRMFLIISLVFVGMMLYTEWQKVHAPTSATPITSSAKNTDIPSENVYSTLQADTVVAPITSKPIANIGETVAVQTDVYKIKISTQGADLVRAELVEHPKTLENPDEGVVILDVSADRTYLAQTGLMGKDNLGPDSNERGRAAYRVEQQSYTLKEGENSLKVPFVWRDANGVKVTKTYHFERGSYVVRVTYDVVNPTDSTWVGSFYGQAKRYYNKENKKSGLIGAQMYQGAAVYTPDKPYKKISFADMKSDQFRQSITGGWAAFVEHYFLCAWVPDKDAQQSYYTQVDGDDIYKIGSITAFEVLPQSSKTLTGQWYIGPEVADNLKDLAPGLELTIDYGILWPISQALFWCLKVIHQLVGNWGWSIVLLTLLVKLAFYPLSNTSYRSMGRMRQLQPQIESLKSRFGEDKQKFSQAMLELYRKEKVNPLGGCLPILIQIPVFIALYYVLLESVELRQAPFILWIHDLSVKDPFYVLPLVMGASMFLQQKMNPSPPDPIQAKIMLLMPVVFTVLFFSFPAGLVLYWVVNNVLSILQQWLIMRGLARDGKKGG